MGLAQCRPLICDCEQIMAQPDIVVPTHPLATSRCCDQPYCCCGSFQSASSSLGYLSWTNLGNPRLLPLVHRQMGLLSCYENCNGIFAENMPCIL